MDPASPLFARNRDDNDSKLTVTKSWHPSLGTFAISHLSSGSGRKGNSMLTRILSDFMRKRVPRQSWKVLTSKRGNKNFFKGKGAISTGYHTSKGRYRILEEKLPVYVVPDLAGFKLKPYVASDKHKNEFVLKKE